MVVELNEESCSWCLTLKEHKGRMVRRFKGKFYLILNYCE